MSMTLTEDLEYEGSWYIGLVLGSITYGIYLGLVVMIIQIIIKTENSSFTATRLTKTFYLLFESLLLLVTIPAFVSGAIMGQLAWITLRHESSSMGLLTSGPGGNGVIAYIWATGGMAQVVSLFLGDALMIYRFLLVFGSRLSIVAIPALCSVSYLVLSIFGYFFSYGNMFAIIPMLIANPMVTAIISIKIITMARRMQKNPGSQAVKSYTGVSAIFIESAAPWTIIGIPVIVTAWLNNNFWWEGIGMLWFGVGLLSPQLVILRIAKGIAWDRKTSQELSQLSTMAFLLPIRNTHDSIEPWHPNSERSEG